MIGCQSTTQTDKDGRFAIEKTLPGMTQLNAHLRVADPSSPLLPPVNVDCLMYQHVIVKAGDPTVVVLGGLGRQVTGKLVGLDSWNDVTLRFGPRAPHVGWPGDDERQKEYGQLANSAFGPILFRDKLPVKADGSFEIEGILPGDYQLFASAPGFTSYAAYLQVEVNPETPGQKPANLDLGVIEVKKPGETKKLPAPPARQTSDKPVAKAVTIRGKAIDDETGKPVERLITQAGKFDPTEPTKVTWGYTEGRSSCSGRVLSNLSQLG